MQLVDVDKFYSEEMVGYLRCYEGSENAAVAWAREAVSDEQRGNWEEEEVWRLMRIWWDQTRMDWFCE